MRCVDMCRECAVGRRGNGKAALWQCIFPLSPPQMDALRAALGPCPGRFCGRPPAVGDAIAALVAAAAESGSAAATNSSDGTSTTNNSTLAALTAALLDDGQDGCGACPRAHRSDGFICRPCEDGLTAYAALFLAFEVLLVLALNTAALHWSSGNRSLPALSARWWSGLGPALVLVAAEAAVAVLATQLALEPQGSLALTSCGVDSLGDWYPELLNPTADCVAGRDCTSEVVFPLRSWVLIYLAISAALAIFARLPILLLCRRKRRGGSLRGAGFGVQGIPPSICALHLSSHLSGDL